MELEHMRRVLAYAIEMPDTLNLPMSTVKAPVWGAYDGRNVYADTRQGSLCVLWEPDLRWDHAGLVIEAMREKEWYMNVLMRSAGFSVEFHPTSTIQGSPGGGAFAKTFPEVVARAAARALGMEDIDGR